MPTDPTRQFDIAISGGSFAGLALAHALRSTFGAELTVAVVDPAIQQPLPDLDVRASALSAASVRLLDALGFWPQLAGEAQPVLRIEITDTRLDAAIRTPILTYDNVLADGEPATFIVPNTALNRVLRAGLDQAPGLSLIAAGVVDVAVSPHHAELTLSDGDTIAARLAVAADGRQSPLRRAAGIKSIGWEYDQIGIVTRATLELPHDGTAVQHFLPGGPFAILPLPDQQACITWSEEAATARRILALDAPAFATELQQRTGGRFGRLTGIQPAQHWTLALNVARALKSERLAVIGDAAHSVHPIAGQGLNLALRDVAALSEVVADALMLGLDPGAGTVLDTYQRWRRFDVAQSTAAYDGLNRLFKHDGMLPRAARGFGLGIVDRLAPLKRGLVAEAAGVTGRLPKLLRGPLQ